MAKRTGTKRPQGGRTRASKPAVAALLPGERLTFGGVAADQTATDEELNSRYAKGEVRIVTEAARYPLSNILTMLGETVEADGKREPRYMLDPQYQRRHRWNPERQSRLIESFLMNVPVPPVFLYERELARYEVMDGRQRLTALNEFYSNKLVLTGLQYWPDLDGRRYTELPAKVRDGIDRRYISSIILLRETATSEEQAASLKKMVFERLNSGGVKLSSQETRNAVYDGPLNHLCLRLSSNPTFREMWGIPSDLPAGEPDDEAEERESASNAGRKMFETMEDVELVLRFFAYRQIDQFPSGLNKISAFLDWYLAQGNKAFSPAVLAGYETLFSETISLLSELLGSDAFCVTGKKQRRPTKIVYDPLMHVASQYSAEPQRTSLLAARSALVDELAGMYDTNAVLFGGRSTNTADALKRNVHMKAAFENAVRKSTEQA